MIYTTFLPKAAKGFMTDIQKFYMENYKKMWNYKGVI